MKTLESSEPQLAVALLLEGVCLVAGFRVLLGSAVEEVTSPPGGPFMGLTVDSPAYSPQDPDRSSLIHAAPASLSSNTQPSTKLLGSLCVQLLVDRPGPRLTSHFQPVLHPE